MATVRIDGDMLHLELKRAEALWAVHGSFAIPLANVQAASSDKPPGFFDSVRLLGSRLWPEMAAGTFLYHNEVVFFDYGREDTVLVIDLLPGASAYRHLFVCVDPPDTPRDAVGRINAALTTTSDPSST